MDDEEEGDENEDEVDEDDDGLVEDVGRELVEVVSEEAALVPNRGDTGEPDEDEEACDIDGDSDAVVVGAEDTDGEVDEEHRDKVGREADALKEIFMNFV